MISYDCAIAILYNSPAFKVYSDTEQADTEDSQTASVREKSSLNRDAAWEMGILFLSGSF